MNLFRSRAPAPSEGSAPRSAGPSKGEGPLGESAVPKPEVTEASMTEFNSARALTRDEAPAARLPVGERAANTAAGPVPAAAPPAGGPAAGELVGGQALLYRIVFLLRQTTLLSILNKLLATTNSNTTQFFKSLVLLKVFRIARPVCHKRCESGLCRAWRRRRGHALAVC